MSRRVVLGFALFVGWIMLAGDISIAQIVLGVVLAFAIEWYARRFGDIPRGRIRLDAVPALVGVVLWDIVVANIQVAKRVLGPLSDLQPRFVRVPIDLKDPTAVALLAAIITITPGTVSAALSPDRRFLTLHALDVGNVAAFVRAIKLRYERPLKEIFE
jgi:multicomponent K+:H+ antiporter subunit E